ncbi:MAG TPA: GNAT family N-acetyltransferase [Rubrivivax sp.]|nr:GNAT family N-acetyltransferase [Rubrivivax sp.]
MPIDAIQLRLARAHDAPPIARMSRDLIETGMAWSYDVPRISRLLREAETSAPVAVDAHTLAGFAVMRFGDESAHLVLLAVDPRYQRRGVARRLLAWLLESALTAGIAELRLELRAGNAGARAFYLASGFDDDGLVSGYYPNGEAALRMRRVLRPADQAGSTWNAPTGRRR